MELKNMEDRIISQEKSLTEMNREVERLSQQVDLIYRSESGLQDGMQSIRHWMEQNSDSGLMISRLQQSVDRLEAGQRALLENVPREIRAVEVQRAQRRQRGGLLLVLGMLLALTLSISLAVHFGKENKKLIASDFKIRFARMDAPEYLHQVDSLYDEDPTGFQRWVIQQEQQQENQEFQRIPSE